MSERATDEHDGIGSLVNSNIRAEAARRGIKHVTVAERVGFSPVALHRRLTGAVSWNLEEIEKVADLLGVTPGDLLAGPRRDFRGGRTTEAVTTTTEASTATR